MWSWLFRRRRKAATFATLFVCMLFLTWDIFTDKDYKEEDYAFEPEVHRDIPTILKSEKPRIPKIFHFVYITGIEGKTGIPSKYKDNVMSFLHFHPNWTYYFWSDSTARELIAKRQPKLLSVYDNYKRVILKADALRYVLMYEFGGVYADMDMKCMRPLDPATMKYACILTPEPFEHSAILYGKPYFFSNALMMCRPKHPFFKQVITLLPTTAHLKGTLESAGTKYFTDQFTLFNKIPPKDAVRNNIPTGSNSPYYFHRSLVTDHDDALYVANTNYFMSSIDRCLIATLKFHILCAIYSSQYEIVKRGCILWKKRRTTIEARNIFSYTDHTWDHMYSIWKSTSMVPIQSLIPQIKEYRFS